MALKNIKVILFDYNDTLVRSKSIKFDAIKDVAKKFYSFTLSTEEIDKYWGKSFRSFVVGLFGEYDSFEGVVKNYNSIRDEYSSVLYKDTKKTIQSLHSLGYILGIVTATTRPYLVKDFDDFGMNLNLFDIVQTTEDTEFHKPDLRVFDGIIDDLTSKDVNKEDILYVGDSLVDKKAALGVGINFVAVVGNTTSLFEFGECEYVEDIGGLIGLL